MTEQMFLTQQQAAEMTGLSELTIRRRISDGTLPGYRCGRNIRVLREDVIAMFKPIPTVRRRR